MGIAIKPVFKAKASMGTTTTMIAGHGVSLITSFTNSTAGCGLDGGGAKHRFGPLTLT